MTRVVSMVIFPVRPPRRAARRRGAAAAKVSRLGFLTAPPRRLRPSVEALRQGLRDLGYVEGKNLVIEYPGPQGK